MVFVEKLKLKSLDCKFKVFLCGNIFFLLWRKIIFVHKYDRIWVFL